jgi:mono/diheme cytochrome c family protein
MGGTGGGMPTLNQAPPRDLTDAAFQASKTDDELLFSVRNGKGNMPAFGVTLTDEQLRDVLLYVRSLAKP